MKRSSSQLISEQIRRQTREDLGAIDRSAAVPLFVRGGGEYDFNQNPVPLEFVKRSYAVTKEDGYAIRPADFYRYSGPMKRETINCADGIFRDVLGSTGDSGVMVHYSLQFSTSRLVSIIFRFNASVAMSMYFSYTPKGAAEQKIKWDGVDSGIIYSGEEIVLSDVPTGRTQIDVFIYCETGNVAIFDDGGVFQYVIDSCTADFSSAPQPPAWDFSKYATTLASSVDGTSLFAVLTSVPENFPEWGQVYIGNDVVCFESRSGEYLRDIRGVNETHAAGAAVSSGGVVPRSASEDDEYGFIDMELNWTRSQYSVDGFPIWGDAETVLYDVSFVTIGGKIFDTVGERTVMVGGDYTASVYPGDIVRLYSAQSDYWDCTVSGVVFSSGFTHVTLGSDMVTWVKALAQSNRFGVNEIYLQKATRSRYSAFDQSLSSYTMRSLTRGQKKEYCLSSIIDGKESAMSSVCGNMTSSILTPPSVLRPTNHISIVAGAAEITVKLLPSYFLANPSVFLSSVKIYVYPSSSRSEIFDPTKYTLLTSGNGPMIAIYKPAAGQDSSIKYYHFYIRLTGANGLIRQEYIGVRALGEDLASLAAPVITEANLISDFNDLDGEPFEEEVLQKIRSAISSSNTGQVISPVVVSGIDLSAAGVTDFEAACFKAVYFGTCTISDREVTIVSMTGETETFAGVGLRGYIFIDAAGHPYIIDESWDNPDALLLLLDDVTPTAGEFGIIANTIEFDFENRVSVAPEIA